MNNITEVSNTLKQASRLLVITGAGISAESGIHTYRGRDGIYDNGKTFKGKPISEVLSKDFFNAHPEIVWEYLREIINLSKNAQPNEAHKAIVKLQRLMHVDVLTQNVDGLHEKAGTNNVIEVHGSLHRYVCQSCHHEQGLTDDLVPRCIKCDGLVRPDIVLYNEYISSINSVKMNNLLFDCLMVVGTTMEFNYLMYYIYYSLNGKIPIIEINPETTRISNVVNYSLRMNSVEALTKLCGELGLTDCK